MQCHPNGVCNIVIDAGQIRGLNDPFNGPWDESGASIPVTKGSFHDDGVDERWRFLSGTGVT
jgi:hypothetical protein